MYQFLSPPSLQKMSANTGTPERAWGFSPPPHTPEGVSGEGSTLALKPFLGWRPHTISVQKAPSPTLGVCFSRQQVVNHSRSLWLLWKVMLSCQGPRQSSFVIQKWMEEACSHILRTETSVGGKRRLSLTLASAVPVSADWHPVTPLEKLEDCCFIAWDYSTLSPVARPQRSTRTWEGKPWRPVTSLWRLPVPHSRALSLQSVVNEFVHSSDIGSLWDPLHHFSPPRLVKSKSQTDWKDHRPPFHPGWARPEEVKGPERSNTLGQNRGSNPGPPNRQRCSFLGAWSLPAL